jgi:hypothetical protein
MMPTRNNRLSVAILISAMLVGVPASVVFAAQGRGHDPAAKADKAERKEGKKEKKAERKEANAEAVTIDREGHVRIIRDYEHGGSLPPGLQKRRPLPPGLRNQLRERGALPPGLQKRLTPVPATLAARLPPLSSYHRRYFAGDDLIVIDTRTHRIAVIIRDVW